jgi:hypothetical protein
MTPGSASNSACASGVIRTVNTLAYYQLIELVSTSTILGNDRGSSRAIEFEGSIGPFSDVVADVTSALRLVDIVSLVSYSAGVGPRPRRQSRRARWR